MEGATGGNEMRNIATPFSIFWSLVWRATVLAPVCFVFQAVVIASWGARFFLPVLIGITAFSEDWISFTTYLAGWLLSIALWRWKAFRKLMEYPPSLL